MKTIRYPRGRLGALFLLLSAGVFASPASAGSLQLTTENYPPFNYQTDSGELDGVSVRLLDEMLRETGIEAEARLLPWSRALAEAQTTPGTCTFSTTRTPEREDHFTWVGPLVENRWHAFVLEDSSIEASSLDDLADYRVGGYRDDAAALFVEARGIEVDHAPNDRLNARKLAADRIDVWVSGEHLGPWYARQEGIGELRSLFAFNDTVMSLACHPETDPDLIDRLQAALDAMHEDGRHAAIVEEVLGDDDDATRE